MEAVLGRLPFASVAPWNRSQRLTASLNRREFETREVGPSHAELELVRAVRRGDRGAFGRLVDLHKQSVHALAARMVGAAEAPDIAQEAFLRAFERLQSFDDRKPVRPWLLAIAYHRCVDELRRRDRTRAQTSEPTAEPISPEHELEVRDQSARMSALLGDLPEQQREALLLFHQEGLSYRDIAGVMDVPLGTVMTWIHRARRTLRARLEESC
jgi:RNA polymerase sigma-70 factor (ECF subfamily)